MPQLTQHLHSYLVKTIHSVLGELDTHPGWTIRDALDHRRRLFDHVVKFMGDKQVRRISASALLDPDALLRPQMEPFAWTDPIKPKDETEASATSPPPAA